MLSQPQTDVFSKNYYTYGYGVRVSWKENFGDLKINTEAKDSFSKLVFPTAPQAAGDAGFLGNIFVFQSSLLT